MKLTLLLIYLIYAALPSFAQNKNYALNDYKLTISGTSTLHDWECSVNDVNAIYALNTSHETIVGIDTLHVTILSESIKSGKKAMDKKLYEALKTEKFPNINFVLTELIEFNENGLIEAKGNLTIAGVTREVTINAQSSNQSWGKVTFSGSKNLNLTDFDIEPPVALFGSIRTGNQITIEFTLTLNTRAGSFINVEQKIIKS